MLFLLNSISFNLLPSSYRRVAREIPHTPREVRSQKD